DPGAGLTLDEIELRLDKPESHLTLTPQTKEALRSVLSTLDEQSADPKHSRTFRKLVIPDQVRVHYKGATVQSELTLSRQQDYEYTGQFAELKESVKFDVRAEDYISRSRTVTVVPPPGLTSLTKQEN